MADKEWVLVDTLSLFRIRYCIQVPAGKKDWALDTIVMGGDDLKEFSQKHLDEVIVSHRVVTEAEALAIFDEDNNYPSWDTEMKLRSGFTYDNILTDSEGGEND